MLVENLQQFKKDHGVLGSHRILDGGSRSLKDRLGEMAGNNSLALAEKRARREASKAAASSTPKTSKPGEEEPNKVLPEKRARTEKPKSQSDPGKGVGSSTSALSSPQLSSGGPISPKITWATPHFEEDAALKLLSQQGQRIFTEFFHNTIDEVAALPQIKKDFKSVTKKLKDDEVKMVEALGKVKSLIDDNLSLEEKFGKLLEEIMHLKTTLVAKKSETIQAVLEKQKTVEEFEAAEEGWKLKAAKYEKEIRRVEDLWDESAECFFHTAIDQIKYLNPEVELRTKGMSMLCVVRDGKWYRRVGKYFVEEQPGKEEITPPPMRPIPLEADAARDDQKGPTESKMVDLGLDAGKE
ncbi:hypothetical protein SESBI_41240 [Sesbania bispinosa]|nr:hypothetical protein SESBI_41240 [Sesbania bispinosa]